MRSAVVLAVLLVTLPAWGDEHDPAAAEGLYRQGREAVARGDLERACALFAESDRLEPAPGTLLNLADCEERRGHLARAWQHFLRASKMFAPGDERSPYSVKRAAALEPRVPHVVITLAAGAPPGVAIHRDDVALGAGALGARIPVDPGEHVVVVRAPGRLDATVRFSLAEGEERRMEVAAGAVAARGEVAAAVPAAGKPPHGSGWRTAGFVVGGLGVAGVLVGATTGLMAMNRAATFRDHCHPYGCDPQGLDAASSGKTLALTSTLGFAVGAAGLAAGASLLFLVPGSRGGVAVAPAAHRNGGSVAVGGSF